MARAGLVADVKGVASDALRIVRTRLELLSIEIQEEKARIVRQVILASAALILAVFGLMLATLWLVMALPEEYRAPVLGFLGLAFIAGAGACYLLLTAKKDEGPFANTVRTLAKDEAALRGPTCEPALRGGDD